MSLTLTYGALNLTASPYLIEFGLDTGAPENVTEALAFLLQDGEVELSSRASNRTLQFNVLIEGANLLALATAEAALVAETEKVLNTLTVDPGDSGPATVFEIFRGQVSLVRDDDWEQARIRRYSVTVKASPFPRSATETVTAALAATGTTTTLVDDGSAATNWTATINGGAATPAVVSGAVKVTSSALSGTVTISMTRTASITTSATQYLMVDWKPETPIGSTAPRVYGDGTELPRVSQMALPSGLTRTWFYVAAASIAILRIDSVTTSGRSPLLYSAPTVRSLAIDNINRTDVKPAIGTNRQLQRTIDVNGSVRSQGSVAIEHASSGLGEVIAYFWPDETAGSSYSPALRPYRSSGGTVTSDSALVSGAREELVANTAVFDVPFLPAGAYLLMCRASVSYTGTATASLTWVASTRVSGSQVGSTYTKTYPILPSAVPYSILTLDRVSLPVVDVDPGAAATTAVTRITLAATKSAGTGAVNVLLDEVWLFNTTIGQFTYVGAGSGTPSSPGVANRVFMASPTVVVPRPALRIGTAADGSDSFYPSGAFWQVPEFKPPRVNVFTVTTGALDASVSLRAPARWHTKAAS